MKVILKKLYGSLPFLLNYAFAFSIFYEKLYNWHNKYVDNLQILYSIFFWIMVLIAALTLIVVSVYSVSSEGIIKQLKVKDLKNLEKSQRKFGRFKAILGIVICSIITLGLGVVGAWFTFLGFLILTLVNIGLYKYQNKLYKVYLAKCEREGTFTAPYTIVKD